jgi:hypothetical protein
MPIRTNPKVYIRFFTFLAPMFITLAAILESALNQNVKGILYVTGVLFTMLLGNLLSSAFPNRVPGIIKGTTNRNKDEPLYDPACNIFEVSSGGWGTLYSSPGPHALFYSFTLAYICVGMFVNHNINWAIFALIIAFMFLSAFLRMSPPMSCVKPIDIMLGYIFGLLCGLAWFAAIYITENSYSPVLDLTYFNQASSDRETCKMEKNKAFRCTKKPTV